MIGEIADVLGGGTPSTKDPSNFGGDIPWLTPKDLAGLHNRYVARGSMSIKSTRSRVMSIKWQHIDTFILHVHGVDMRSPTKSIGGMGGTLREPGYEE